MAGIASIASIIVGHLLPRDGRLKASILRSKAPDERFPIGVMPAPDRVRLLAPRTLRLAASGVIWGQ
jgi:hypothetical protein